MDKKNLKSIGNVKMKQLVNLVPKTSMRDFAQPKMSWRTKVTLKAVLRDAQREQNKMLRQAEALKKNARLKKTA